LEEKGSVLNVRESLWFYFYPKDDTPGCTIEVCRFRDKYDLFQILGAEVWGVSNGDKISHLAFAEKINYSIHFWLIKIINFGKLLECKSF
tara:strand:- start:279 stop:548 length:270 start_codon:yes stop_codon:yes gene_type:complete